MKNLLMFYYNPIKAFSIIEERPRWVLAFNLVVVFTIISSILQVQFVFLPHRQEMYTKYNFTQEQIEEAEERFQGPMIYVLNILAPFIYVVLGLVIVALFFYLFFPVLGRDITFRRTFSVVSNSALIRIPAFTIKTPLTISAGNYSVYTGLGFFLQFLDKNSFLFRFLAKFDFFTLWEVLLIGFGLAVVSKWKKTLTMPIVIGAWIIANFVLTIFPVTLHQ